MRLVIVGCEYSGTTTLAYAIDDWLDENVGARFPLLHDHWKIPHTSGHPEPDMSEDERRQVLALSPELKEMTQRHSLYYHIQPNSWLGPDWLAIGLHIDDGIYGPMNGYGGVGMPHDRKVVGRQVEDSMLRFAPDVVLVHARADADVIAARMAAEPREHSPMRASDIPELLGRYETAVAESTLRRKISVDTGGSVEDAVAEFARKIERHLSDADRSRILVHRGWQAAG